MYDLFHQQAKEAIPAEVRMISGCEDAQTSADVSNVETFQLPDPAGRAGGACTSALLKVLYADRKKPYHNLSFRDVLHQVRDILAESSFSQIPQLSSSRPFNMKTPFELVPEGHTGQRRAVLIGINYVGQQGELSGCHNDVMNIKEYIMDVHGFPEANITMLLDDGVHPNPTRANIMAAYRQLVAVSQPGDSCFCHYSGHGGKLKDDNGDEEDGFDETLIPLDYTTAGQIRDDLLFTDLVGAMPSGVTLTCFMDCCHSGTVLDLPYVFKADGSHGDSDETVPQPGFKMGPLLTLASKIAKAGSMLQSIYSAFRPSGSNQSSSGASTGACCAAFESASFMSSMSSFSSVVASMGKAS